MMQSNKYKAIPGYPGYSISAFGEVYSEKRGHVIATAKNHAGYLTVTITDGTGYRGPRKVHRLVYLTYVGPLVEGMVVDHRDDNMYNNHYSNLQQILPGQNSRKSFVTGKNSEKVVWTKQMIHDICKMITMNIPNKQIFESLGVDYNSNRYNCNHLIGDLIRGTMHRDVTINYDLSKYVHGVNKADAKLSIVTVKTIYARLILSNVTPAELARYYDVSHSTICKIRDKKTWQEATDYVDRLIGV